MLVRALLTALSLVAFAAAASAFEGSYASGGRDFSRSAKISSNGPGTYRVDLTVTARNCTGELEAYGEVVRGSLVATPPTQDDPCKVTILRRGTGIVIREQQCLNWHGVSCDFSGALNRE